MTRAALLVGLASLALAAFGWFTDAQHFTAGWLAAVTILAAWPLGSIALLFIHALTGGKWGDVLRPSLRTGVFALPLLFVALLPLIPGAARLYPWARAGAGAHLHNLFYLNMPFLAARVVIYGIVWSALAVLSLSRRLAAPAAPASLFALAVTVSFAAIDSTMSLDPHFVSSIYGMLTGAGMVLLALSVSVLLSANTAPPESRADLGRLLLALCVLWIYLDFMQLLIVWQSNLAHDATWYTQRAQGVWGAMRALIAVGHFALPVALLLSPRLQRARGALMSVAALLIGMEILRAWWTILPAAGVFITWTDLACMLALCALAAALAPRAAQYAQTGRPRHG